MRTALVTCYLLLLTFSLSAQSVIRTLAWELDTARPALQEWALVRGETCDLECRYLNGSSSMDVTGAAVVLHARTNGMASGISYQVTGTVGRVSSANMASVGWVTVRVKPGEQLPPDVTRCTFTLETTLDDARNLVASGTLRLSGDPTGALPSTLPVYGYDPAGSAQSVSNALALALQSALSAEASARISASAEGSNFTSSAVAPLATTQQLAAAVAALPPPSNDALRLVTPDSTQWQDATGNVWRVSFLSDTNFIVVSACSENWTGPAVGSEYLWDDYHAMWTNETSSIVYEAPTWSLIYGSKFDYDTAVSVSTDIADPTGLYVDADNSSTVSIAYKTTSTTQAVDRVRYASEGTFVTLSQLSVEKELHADSYTNLVWRSVYSNGWCWLVAYTNTAL